MCIILFLKNGFWFQIRILYLNCRVSNEKFSDFPLSKNSRFLLEVLERSSNKYLGFYKRNSEKSWDFQKNVRGPSKYPI